MKLKFMASAALMMLLAACGGGGENGVKFNPKPLESNLTPEQRAELIARQRESLALVDSAVVFGDGVKLTVLSPLPDAENFVTEAMSRTLAMKMLQIASKNGVSGLGTDANFALMGAITGVDRKKTATAPQKTMITYTLSLFVLNVPSETVFATGDVKITGVGDTDTQAAINAAQELTDNNQWQQLLATAQSKIVEYYEANLPAIKANVESLIAGGRFTEAYAVLNCVPRQATKAFEYAAAQMPRVSEQIMLRESASNLAALRNAIAMGQNEYNPEAGAILALIPKGAPEYAEANGMFDRYVADLRQRADSAVAFDRSMTVMNAQAAMMQQMQKDTQVAGMTSIEMRKQIALEDSAGKPWKLLFNKVGYALNKLFE